MLLTINGKRPNPDLEQHLRNVTPQEKLSARISRLLDGNPFSILEAPDGISGMGYDTHSADTEIKTLFHGLYANHPVIEELKSQIEQRIEEVETLPSDDARLKYTESRGNRYSESLFALARTHSEWGYKLIRTAAYARAQNPVFTNEVPPSESRLMSELAAILGGYRTEHPDGVLEYTKLMDEKKLCLPWVMNSYADFGDPRGLDLYVELLKVSGGNDTFVFNGVKRDIAFGYIAFSICRELSKHEFTKEDFLKRIKKLPTDLQRLATENIDERAKRTRF